MKTNIHFLLLLFFCTQLVAECGPAGTIDLTFGPNANGTVLVDFNGGDDEPNAVAIGCDGRIIAAGSSDGGGNRNFAVAGFTPDGIVDPTFGSNGNGTIQIDFGGTNDIANQMAIDQQGRIILVGETNATGSNQFAITRLTPDGIIDTTFGTNGLIIFNFGTSSVANAVTVDCQGRIIVAGQSNTTNQDFALVRFDSTGAVDTTFGTGGSTTFDFGGNDVADALAVDRQNRIILAGFSDVAAPEDFAVARFTPDGLLDTTFGTAGGVLINFGGSDFASAVAVTPDNKIIVFGDSSVIAPRVFALTRLNPDGTTDNSFGTNNNGQVLLAFGGTDMAEAMVIDLRGKINTVGFSNAQGTDDFALARFNPDGSIDTDFGLNGNGKVLFNFGATDQARAVVRDCQGRLVLAGPSNVDGTRDFALARFCGEMVNAFATALCDKYRCFCCSNVNA